MNTPKTLFIVLVIFLVAAESSAQSPRGRGARRTVGGKPATPQPVAQPEPSPAPASEAPPSAPIPLAVVNGQSITSADIDPKVREEVEALEGRIAEARRQILELQVNT